MFKTILFLMGIIGTALSGLIYLGTDIDTVKEMGPLIIITTTAITAPYIFYSFFSWFEEKDNKKIKRFFYYLFNSADHGPK